MNRPLPAHPIPRSADAALLPRVATFLPEALHGRVAAALHPWVPTRVTDQRSLLDVVRQARHDALVVDFARVSATVAGSVLEAGSNSPCSVILYSSFQWLPVRSLLDAASRHPTDPLLVGVNDTPAELRKRFTAPIACSPSAACLSRLCASDRQAARRTRRRDDRPVRWRANSYHGSADGYLGGTFAKVAGPLDGSCAARERRSPVDMCAPAPASRHRVRAKPHIERGSRQLSLIRDGARAFPKGLPCEPAPSAHSPQRPRLCRMRARVRDRAERTCGRNRPCVTKSAVAPTSGRA